MLPVALPEPSPILIGGETHHIYYPHEVFACIFANYRDTWENFFDPAAAREFWAAVSETKQYRCHPLRHRKDKRLALPIGLHGDGAPVAGKGKSYQQGADFLSFSSLLARGVHRAVHVVIAAVWSLVCNFMLYFILGCRVKGL